ncbi:hypothetical protein TIFTF001_053826 [Ficus carica]|uniref:Uncharacterized protein n=1 Tax=Ficus carica TaxID=3494 RepID=A0AA88EG24_FICCA|nr:hypothetical protein TIFTF001_053826 [Ficus carica]
MPMSSKILVDGLGFHHNLWARSFSDDPELINSFASMTPLLALSILLDAFQCVLSGVARGCGWQHVAAYVNFVAFYLVGMTIAALLAFTFKLYVKGLWIGLICGLFCQAAALLFMTLRTKWIKLQSTENCEKVDPVLARNE